MKVVSLDSRRTPEGKTAAIIDRNNVEFFAKLRMAVKMSKAKTENRSGPLNFDPSCHGVIIIDAIDDGAQ